MARQSNLMDPMIYDSDLAVPVVTVWEKLAKVNFLNLMVNFIIPFVVVLMVAFYLKSCYDAKKERRRELLLN